MIGGGARYRLGSKRAGSGIVRLCGPKSSPGDMVRILCIADSNSALRGSKYNYIAGSGKVFYGVKERPEPHVLLVEG